MVRLGSRRIEPLLGGPVIDPHRGAVARPAGGIGFAGSPEENPVLTIHHLEIVNHYTAIVDAGKADELALGLNWALLFEAYRYTTVAVATLCYYMQPVFLTLAAVVLLGEKLNLKKGLCILVALCGMILISGVIGGGIPEARELTGIGLGLGAACLYAGVILCNKKLKEIGAYDKTIVQLLAAALVMAPYCALTGERFTAETFQPVSLACLLVLGMFHTGFAYALYFGSMKALRAQTIAIFSYIDPVIAIILSVTVLHEPFSILSAVGSVLILGAAFVSEKT